MPRWIQAEGPQQQGYPTKNRPLNSARVDQRRVDLLGKLRDITKPSRHQLHLWTLFVSWRGSIDRNFISICPSRKVLERPLVKMGIKQLFSIIKEEAPEAIKEGEIKNQFGRKVAIVSLSRLNLSPAVPNVLTYLLCRMRRLVDPTLILSATDKITVL